jgi:DNA-directed RNA polymerase specialized sigma24 family protein
LIQLRFLDGLPVAAVAARLDKTDAAVVALSKRALDALRAAMERLGDFTHGA